MSKTIEELRAEVQAATVRRDEAYAALSAAQKALEAARLEATGLAGHHVTGERWSNKHTIVADRMGRWNDNTIEGRVVKKDGIRGVMRAEIDLTKPYTDHGLWQS